MTPQKGGYTPSVMGNLLISGPMLLGAAFFQGRRLIENNKTRMKSRRRASTRHVGKRRKTRATHLRRYNA